ncbi:MAG: hypothetical protein ABSB42_17200 [Tepidisphaeraceae bacterium]|jgi:hypothetical protein
MSYNLRQYSDEVWDRFFDFVFPCDEKLTRQEVQAELQRQGIDARPAIARVREALEARRAREALTFARESRSDLLTKAKNVSAPVGQALRETLRQIISRLSGSEQAAYFHKLERAASEDDMQSLLEDLHRLDAISKDGQDAGKSAK